MTWSHAFPEPFVRRRKIDTLCEAGQLVLALPESHLKADPLRQAH